MKSWKICVKKPSGLIKMREEAQKFFSGEWKNYFD